APPASRAQVVRVGRQVLDAVLGDEHEVLEAAAAEPPLVEARLDRDDVAGDHRVPRGEAEARLLVQVEADAVPEAVDEALLERLAQVLVELGLVAVSLEELARAAEDDAAVDTGAAGGEGVLDGLEDEAVHLH